MIILASSIILTLNNSGIISKANQAVEDTDLAQVKNMAALKWAEVHLSKSETDLAKYVEKALKDEGIDTSKYVITVTENGVDVELKVVPDKWTENVVAMVDGVPIPKGFVASSVSGENTKSGGLVIYEGNENVTNSNVEDAKRTRNQYVWIPVDSASFDAKFMRQNFGLFPDMSYPIGNGFGEVVPDIDMNFDQSFEQEMYRMCVDQILATEAECATYFPPTQIKATDLITQETLAEVQAMYASVKEYGGFYMARYETGIDTQRKSDNGAIETNVYSMMGKIPYNFARWTLNNAMDEESNGAVQVARSIYTADNSDYGVISTLVYGVQWDATLQWWLDTNAVESVANSTSYGNHKDHVINSSSELNEASRVFDYESNSNGSYVSKDDETIVYPKTSETKWILSTGALKAGKIKNLYDMAGNVMEWTMEAYSNKGRVCRGGEAGNVGYNVPVAYRMWGGPNAASVLYGFRCSLYKKNKR